MPTRPNVLTIAGSDSGCGAGIQADIKTIMALKGYGLSIITALTAQNGCEVKNIYCPNTSFLNDQFDSIFEGFEIHSCKTGMLYTKDIIEIVSQRLKDHKFPLIVDPVAISQSGNALIDDDAINALVEKIIPLADLVTPNRPEAEMLSNIKINDKNDAQNAANKIFEMGAKAVLIKGGHMQSSIMVTDLLFIKDEGLKELNQARVDTNNTHGTGCTLSAAIATYLGQDIPLQIAATKAQEFVNLCLRKSFNPGKGHGPLNHGANMI